MDEQQPPVPNAENDDSAVSEEDPEIGRKTQTTDVQEDAKEALRMFEAQQKQSLETRAGALIEAGQITLHVQVEGSSTPMEIVLNEEMVVGRRDPSTNEAPEIDLTPYGGYQMGVSRRHAMVRLREKRLEAVDLGSRNGTFINGYQLKPHQPVALQDGDEMRVGKVVMHLRLVKA